MTSLERLVECARKPVLRAVGLMSGTSADGVDAALVEISGRFPDLRVTTIAALTEPFQGPRELGARFAEAEHLALHSRHIGIEFAAAALAVIRAAGLTPGDVDVIGSHGQTVTHLPRRGVLRQDGTRGAVTLQVGDPAVIRERTGIAVVHDFRAADVAAGGEGAPLVPIVDWLLLRSERGARIALNLGGIANATRITPRLSDVMALDTGPANGPLDAAVYEISSGGQYQDDDGQLAAAGKADEAVVAALLRQRVLASPPPRSFDRATFGMAFVRTVVNEHPDLPAEDLLATLTEFVAAATVGACVRYLGAGEDGDVSEVLVSGGGVHNPTLMAALARRFAPVTVRSTAEVGIDPDAKEAVAFAVLASETIRGRAGNLPAVTGAAGPRVLGSIIP